MKDINKIENILEENYGVSLETCSPQAILWAASLITDDERAKDELKRANDYRAKIGQPLAYPDYGSRLF